MCFDHRTSCYCSSVPTGALNLAVSGRCCLWSHSLWCRGTLPRGQKGFGGSAEMTANRPLRQDCYRLIGVPPSRDAYYAMECLSGRAEKRLQALLAERGPKCLDVWRGCGRLGGPHCFFAISILMLFGFFWANSSLLICSLCTQEKQRRVEVFFPLVLLIQDRTEGVCRHLWGKKSQHFNKQTCFRSIYIVIRMYSQMSVCRDTFFGTERPCLETQRSGVGGCCGDGGRRTVSACSTGASQGSYVQGRAGATTKLTGISRKGRPNKPMQLTKLYSLSLKKKK